MSHKEGMKSKSMGRVSDQIRKALVVILHGRDHLSIQMLCLFPVGLGNNGGVTTVAESPLLSSSLVELDESSMID
jgi:hypothetical protein